MLAEGTLRVDNFSVAKQATSLPSSTSKKTGPTEPVSNKEEGAAFVGLQADDVVSLGTSQQTRDAEATDKQQADALVETADKQSSEATRESLDEARKAERERIKKIAAELNDKLNENLSLKFGHDEKSGKDFFQLVEKDSGDVIRQIPSEEILDFMRKFKDFAGLLFSQQA